MYFPTQSRKGRQLLEKQDLPEARDGQGGVGGGAPLRKGRSCRTPLGPAGRHPMHSFHPPPGLSRGSHVGHTPSWPSSENCGELPAQQLHMPPSPPRLPMRPLWARSRRGGDPVATAPQTQKQLGPNPELRPLGPVSFPKHPPASGGLPSRGSGPEPAGAEDGGAHSSKHRHLGHRGGLPAGHCAQGLAGPLQPVCPAPARRL